MQSEAAWGKELTLVTPWCPMEASEPRWKPPNPGALDSTLGWRAASRVPSGPAGSSFAVCADSLHSPPLPSTSVTLPKWPLSPAGLAAVASSLLSLSALLPSVCFKQSKGSKPSQNAPLPESVHGPPHVKPQASPEQQACAFSCGPWGAALGPVPPPRELILPGLPQLLPDLQVPELRRPFPWEASPPLPL